MVKIWIFLELKYSFTILLEKVRHFSLLFMTDHRTWSAVSKFFAIW